LDGDLDKAAGPLHLGDTGSQSPLFRQCLIDGLAVHRFQSGFEQIDHRTHKRSVAVTKVIQGGSQRGVPSRRAPNENRQHPAAWRRGLPTALEKVESQASQGETTQTGPAAPTAHQTLEDVVSQAVGRDKQVKRSGQQLRRGALQLP
jgi:hypothetical protein